MRSKPLVIVVISFVLVALIYYPYSRTHVVSATRGPLQCSKQNMGAFMIHCCQTETGRDGIEIRYCTDCDDFNGYGPQPNTHPPENCSPRYQVEPGSVNPPTGPKSGEVLPQPPLTPPKSNDAQVPNGGGPIQQTPPPSTALQQTTCPDGSARDASGNCPLVTQTPPPPALINNNNNNNNNPTPDHQKGSNLGQIGGGQSVTKKGNSDNSPTPPACPDKGPIPPDCTLKPKF